MPAAARRGNPRAIHPAARTLLVAPLVALACSREPPPVERREPWLASASAAASAPAPRARFEVAGDPVVRVSVPGREGRPEGALSVARGTVEVDLADLGSARGTVEVDLTSLTLEGADVAEARLRTERARSWLDLGSSRPAAARERVRWATLTLTGLEEPSAAAAHLGRREKARPAMPMADGGVTVSGDPAPSASAAPASPPDTAAAPAPGPAATPSGGRSGSPAAGSASGAPPAGSAPDAPAAGSPSGAPLAPPAEVRVVDAVAVGHFTLHARRVPARIPVRLHFEYPGAASAGPPGRVVVETRGPWVVGLATHDIVPRDSLGTAIAAELALLGAAVGREARVAVWLPLERR